MRKVRLRKVSLGSVGLHRIAFSDYKKSEPKPPWFDVANLLTENGGFFLLENGGALLLENHVKQIKLGGAYSVTEKP